MEGVIGNPGVRDRVRNVAVGLAAPCDPPEAEPELSRFFTERFPAAPSLPFVAFVTHDFQFVHGFTDARSAKEFLADLDIAQKSPLFPATEQDEESMRKLAATAAAAADSEDWAAVLQAGRAAAKIPGRCDSRPEVEDAVQEARDWARNRLDEAVDALLSTDGAGDPKANLDAVRKVFKGEPEADEAAQGLDAMAEVARIRKAGPSKADAARGKARERFRGTRWERLFE